MSEVIKHSAESVSCGHPDKIADQISDAILDLYLTNDSNAHVAIETMVTSNNIIVSGEVSSVLTVHPQQIESVIRKTIDFLGYKSYGWNTDNIEIINLINTQSPDIAAAVNDSDTAANAGDQGIMIGYATKESPDYLPLAKSISNAIINKLWDCGIPEFGPDAKCMVNMVYGIYDKPYIDYIILSTQHKEGVAPEFIFDKVMDIINSVVKKYSAYITEFGNTKIDINPSGKFVIGGPVGDTGVTGRKIIADTYGDYCSHGGGAFSGKDPTKVDRSAAYYARYIAKNIVANGFADTAKVELTYAIGRAYPKSISLDTFGTNKTAYSDDGLINKLAGKVSGAPFDCSVGNIRKVLDLKTPRYLSTARTGHFSDKNYPWEKIIEIKL